MKRFFTTYTIAFFILSVCLIGFGLLPIENSEDHPIRIVWDHQISTLFFPLAIVFFFPALVVLLSGGIAQLSCLKECISRITVKYLLTDLAIIAGCTFAGIGMGFASVFFFQGGKELPAIYWLCTGTGAFLFSLLAILWKNNYRNLKACHTEDEKFRPNHKFRYALFNTSLEIAILWMMIGLLSTPFAYWYDELVQVITFTFATYVCLILPLALVIYLRDRFVSSRSLRILLMGFILFCTLGIIFIPVWFIYDMAYKGIDFTESIEAYEREREEARLQREAKEQVRTEAAKPYTGHISEVTFVDENYYPVIHEFSFDFLWEDPKADLDSVTSAITFVRKEIGGSYLLSNLRNAHHIYKYTAEGYHLEEDLDYYENGKGSISFAMLCGYLTRTFPVKNMASIAYKYIDYLPTFLPESSFRNSYFENALIDYMLAYEDLYNSADDFEAFRQVYDVVNSPPDIEEDEEEYHEIKDKLYYDKFAPYVHAEDYTSYYLSDEFIKSYATKIYSFWARRYKDGTHRDCYYIMKQIYQLYN
ncbi:MAG: hypothetical protein LUG98_13950 [Tannerellaceae bacterium]|nr:hypothetical protein [Tannerellaceae bacterium]